MLRRETSCVDARAPRRRWRLFLLFEKKHIGTYHSPQRLYSTQEKKKKEGEGVKEHVHLIAKLKHSPFFFFSSSLPSEKPGLGLVLLPKQKELTQLKITELWRTTHSTAGARFFPLPSHVTHTKFRQCCTLLVRKLPHCGGDSPKAVVFVLALPTHGGWNFQLGRWLIADVEKHQPQSARPWLRSFLKLWRFSIDHLCC